MDKLEGLNERWIEARRIKKAWIGWDELMKGGRISC